MKGTWPTAIGTQRRIQALMTRSWALAAIARDSGLRAPQLARALENPATITPKLAAKMSVAYDQLWGKEPPRSTQHEREIAAAACALALDGDWAPPLAWDDEQIDKADAQPAEGWRRPARSIGRSADLAEDAGFIRAAGGYEHASLSMVAVRLGVSKAQLEKAISRQRSAESRDRELEAG